MHRNTFKNMRQATRCAHSHPRCRALVYVSVSLERRRVLRRCAVVVLTSVLAATLLVCVLLSGRFLPVNKVKFQWNSAAHSLASEVNNK